MKKIDIIFYSLLVLCIVIRFIPAEYMVAVYTPSLLGWVFIAFFVPVTLILFAYLLIYDLRNKRLKMLFMRVLYFTLTVSFFVIYHSYLKDAHS
ncbi:hypothetical protein GCM10011344_41440 [Dokdonia pacifica]|uniref:Uncharacterized protein n=1 Tax=Dokdonia pacifica TaxID=1627892 RepID=A0A239ACJ7_9FLAO|nr:hypothetical protein GCM10011344_41440 [Dokdonia pacifica]SNR93345.1 hypothetical protein SAMN06265376_104330 [Dokdonia pacifica]